MAPPASRTQRIPPTSLLQRLLCCSPGTTSRHDLEEGSGSGTIADQPGARGTQPTTTAAAQPHAHASAARMHGEGDEHPRPTGSAASPAGPPTPQAAGDKATALTPPPERTSAFAAAAAAWPRYEPSATRSADAARSSARLQLQQELAARPQQHGSADASLDAQCWPLNERAQPSERHAAVATADAPLPPIVEAAGEDGSTSASNAAPVTPPPAGAAAGLEQAPTFSLPIPIPASPVSPAAAAAALEAAGDQTDSTPGSNVAATTPQSTPDASSSQPGQLAVSEEDEAATPPASPSPSGIPASPFTSPRAQAAVTSELRHAASPRGGQQQQGQQRQLEAQFEHAVVTQIRPARASSLTTGADPSRVWALIAHVGGDHSDSQHWQQVASVTPHRSAAAYDAASRAQVVAEATAAAAAVAAAQPPDQQQHVSGSSAGSSASSLPDAPPGLRKLKLGKPKAPIAVSTESNVVSSGPQVDAALGQQQQQQQRSSNEHYSISSSAGSNRLSSEHSAQHCQPHQLQQGRDELMPTFVAASSRPGSAGAEGYSQQQQVSGLPRIQTSRWAGLQQPAVVGGASPPPPPLPPRPRSSTSLAALGTTNSSSNSASSNTHNFFSGASAYYTAPTNALHAANFPASAAAGGSPADDDVWGPFARQQQRQQQREQAHQHWQQQRHSLSSEGDERTSADEWEVLPVVLTPLKVPRSHALDDVLADTPRTPRTSVVGESANNVIDVMLSEEGVPLVPTSGRYSRDDDEYVQGLNSPFLSLPVNALHRHASGTGSGRHDQQQRTSAAAAAVTCGTPRRFAQSTSGDFFGRASADLPARQRRLSAGVYSSHGGGAQSFEGLRTALAPAVGGEPASVASSHWFSASPSITDSEVLRHQQQQLQAAGSPAAAALGSGGASSRAGWTRAPPADGEPPSTPRGSAIGQQQQQPYEVSVSSPVTVAAARAKAIAAAIAQSAAVGSLVGTGAAAAAAARRDSSEAANSSTSSNAVATSSSNLASSAALFSRSGWAAIGHQLPAHQQLQQHLSAGQAASLFATPQRPQQALQQASAVLPAPPPRPSDEL